MVQLVGSSSLGLGKLIDGKNQFVHIRYSANADGSNMTIEIQADTKYIGIATNSSETAPTSPSDYSWGRFVGTSGTSSYTWIRYSSNEDGSNMTTTTNEETKYIGVAITSENSAPTDHTKYSWALFKGEDGRGVKKTEVSYQKSTSGTVIPTGSWSASIPSVSDGEYLWTRTLFTYTDGTTTSTYNVSRNGISGLGIARADVHYQKSTSGTTVPIGTWTVTIPAVEANEYLWTRTTITYTDDSTSVSYSVGKMGADGKDAQLLYLTATSEIQAFDSDDKPKTTQPITISAKLQNASGTATFVAIPYIGNTAQTPITLGGTGNDRTLLPSQWTDPKWTIIAITATLGSLTDTVSIHKLKDGQNGADGADGSPGVGVESATITYAASTSGTVHPTGGWSETIPSVPSGQYLWTRTVWLYTNGMSETSYSVSMMGERGPQGPKGDQGNDGVAGKDGVGVRSTVITYGLSDSDTTQPTSWSAQVPTLTKGKYLWTKTVWSYTDSTSETSYQKTYIARDGNDGTDGLPGKDGVGIRSTTITYAVSESGTTKPVGGWSTTVPTVPSGQYLWTRTVWTYTDDTSETGYSVAKMGERGPQGPQGLQGIQGPKGDQGIAGPTGADGLTSYTHIAYANSADGTKDFSVSDSNRIYIGVYVDFNATDSTSPSSYQWSLIKGADGADGAPGKPGADGRTPYFHTAYANSADGSSGFSTTDSNGKLYLGTCTDYTQADPTDYRAYTWVKIKGEQGPQGIQGPSGANGQSLYTWLKYADDANGSGMSEAPDGKKYIGLAYNRPIPTESSNPEDYTWSLIQGENGVNGIDGKTYYTWVKYADTSTGGGLSDNPAGKSYIGLAYNKTTSTESTNPGDYSWSLIKGDKGDTGNGIAKTTISYGVSSSGTTAPTSWSSTIPTVSPSNYLWTKTVITYTDNTTSTSYSVGKMGEQGAKGDKGDTGATLYTWVKYANDANGSGMSDYPSGKKYIGLAYNKTTATESSIASDYQWALIQGEQGIPGQKGDDGATLYTWIKYADNASGSGLSDSANGKKYVGIAYNKTTSTESTNPADYTWSLIQGPQGPAGQNGKGVSSYSITYQAGTSGTTPPTGTWSSTIPTVPKGQYLWSKTTLTYTDNTTSDTYSVAYFPVNGETGNGISSYTAEFYLSTSKTTQSGGSWTTTPPTWSNGKYLWTRYKIGYTNGSTAYTTPHCSSEWEAVNDIQVGGRNLLRHSAVSTNNLKYFQPSEGTTVEVATDGSIRAYKITAPNTTNDKGARGSFNDGTKNLLADRTYTYSFWLKSNMEDDFHFTSIGHFQTRTGVASEIHVSSNRVYKPDIIKANVWTKVSASFYATKDCVFYPYFWYLKPNQVIHIYDLMLEEGTTPTTWSPAPEDTQDQIDQANENISNKVDQGAYDQDKSVIYDDINKKLDDEEFREFQKIMNELKGSYDSFVGEGGRYEQELKNSLEREQAIVKEFGDKVNQLNFINTYIRESEEGLVIGAKNSPMQMLLSKDSLSFMDGGQVVAYFSNQSFYINRGAVVESLQVGVHKLTKVGNEHTVIQYIPK